MRGGDGIGSNCSDPNFSIYNTNLLKLFPYKGGTKEEDDKREREKSKQTQQQIQRDFMRGSTVITDPVQLDRLEQARITEAERDRENKRIIDLLEANKTKLVPFPTTPMTQKEINRQNKKDKKDNEYLNSEQKKEGKLTIDDLNLGGSTKRKTKSIKTNQHKSRKSRKSRRGGVFTLDDQYKDDEGSQH
jgi:hypothetical protein